MTKTSHHSTSRRVLCLFAASIAMTAACGNGSGGAAAPAGASRVNPSSSGPPSASTSTRGDPACGLVTKADVSTAVGYQIVKSSGVNSGLVGTDICTFQGEAEGKVVYVTIYNTPQAQRLPLEIQLGSEPVSGLGDSAFWASSAGFFVRTRGRVLGLQDLSMTADRDALAALAAKALPNM